MNALFENIQRHLMLLDKALYSSHKIAIYARLENLDRVVDETDNRERLVNAIGEIQHSIENQTNQLSANKIVEEDVLILKAWFHDLAICSEKMIELDKETVEILGQQKEETTKEIAHIFKNKEMFKGYNHSLKK